MRKKAETACVVLAGGRGTRLYELTQGTCKPALPFGPSHRIVDWTLNNVRQSGITDLIVATQYMPRDLNDHLSCKWQVAFGAGMRIANGIAMTGNPVGYAGTADAVRHNLGRLRKTGATTVLIVAADHIYDMDYRGIIAAHRDSGAGITVAATVVPLIDASAFGVVKAGRNGRIADFLEKPSRAPEMPGQPGRALVSMGIYVCDIDWLADALSGDGDDFGHDILPRAVAAGLANYHRVATTDGALIYWQDVGTLDAYRAVLLDLIARPWACSAPGAPGESVASDEARHWARHGTIILPGGGVAPGAFARNAIIAPGAHLGATEAVGEDPRDDGRWFRVTPRGTTLVTAAMLDRRRRHRGPDAGPTSCAASHGQTTDMGRVL